MWVWANTKNWQLNECTPILKKRKLTYSNPLLSSSITKESHEECVVDAMT